MLSTGYINRAGNRLLKSLALVATLGSIYLPVSFAGTLQALDAQAKGDYKMAATLWLQLANDGDVIAQYNLALLYKFGEGVTVDKNMSNYWLTMAARQGMVQAYQSLNTSSVQATEQRLAVASLDIGPQQWVSSQNPRYYTLQLASSTNRQLIEKYYSLNDLSGKAGYYSSMRQGERWYALVYGSYNSVHSAKSAITDLPQNLRKWSPWVRNIRSIHKIMISE